MKKPALLGNKSKTPSVYTKDSSTTTITWRFAVMVGNERAALRKRRQKITYDTLNSNWKVQDHS